MSTVAIPSPLRHDAEVIGLVGLAHGTSHFFHLLLPPLFPWLMQEFGLSFTQAGFLMTVFFVVSGIGQAAAGFVVDRVGPQPVLYFGIGTLSVAALLVGLSASYAALIFSAAVAGLGNSIFHPADFTLLNRCVSTSRLGHAFSMHGLSGNIGWALAPAFLTLIATESDWHVAAFAASALGAGVLALLLLRRSALGDGSPEHVIADPEKKAFAGAVAPSPFAFLRSPAVWTCFAFFFLSTAAFGILQNYAPTVLGHVYGISLAGATAGLTAYMLGSAAGVVAGGFAAVRVTNSERVIAAMLAFAALMSLLLASGIPPAWVVFAGMGAMGFGVGISGPSRDLLVRKAATAQFGRTSFGRVYGFVYSGLDVGLAAAPLAIGPVLDGGNFSAALYAVAALQVAALASALHVGAQARRLAA